MAENMRNLILVDNKNQTKRDKMKKLDNPLMGVLHGNDSKMKKLPSNCLQHIMSFVTYEKTSQMRQVCKTFNEIGKKLLEKGHRQLERQLMREIERAEQRVLFSSNARSSYDMLHFLNGLHDAINKCTISYALHVDYFVAGKLLDAASCLLKDFNSSTMLPYFPENVYEIKLHPLLESIVDDSTRAYQHFSQKILGPFIYINETAIIEKHGGLDLEVRVLMERNKMKMLKTELLKNRNRKLDCGKEMSGELLKLIVKLNEKVLESLQMANRLDAEVKKVISGRKLLDEERNNNNCLFQLSKPSPLPLNEKRPVNLATLPSSCVQNIVSRFNCDKKAQLRRVSKSFNSVCKKQMNRELEKVKEKWEFQTKINETRDSKRFTFKIRGLETNTLNDLSSFLLLCADIYKWHSGVEYFFIAGKAVDEAERIVYRQRYQDDPNLFLGLDRFYENRPHSSLFRLMDLVYKAVAHFKFNIAPEYLPSTQKRTYVPDYIISAAVMDFEIGNQSSLEEIEQLIEKAEEKIKDQRDRNGKFLRIIIALKKTVLILNTEIYEKMNSLKVDFKL